MHERGPDGIAIVGMSGRFPGAATLATFWRNLCDGVESIRHFAPAELNAALSADVHAHANFVAARSVLDDVAAFDAEFFGMHARDAALTDPQQRVFLECCWEALEDAGYDPATYPGAIGVYGGASINTYLLHHVLRDRAASERFTSDYQVDSYPELLGAGVDFLATRVAYKLNLRGPAITVQTACSTSLVAVAQACGALLLRQADMMLAGGVSISFPQERGYLHTTGGMVSADGRCRTFDAAASGTVFGAGAGVVVLKRLADALADGDSIYAVIRGFGVSNDGSSKAGFTAPSAAGQAAAIATAHAMAGFEPHSIGYVECHGTATPLGDPIEVAALLRNFPPSADGTPYCLLGSVKPNIGHLDNAAGISGLIKTALAIRFGKIPPTLHYTAPNPRIPLAGSAFAINAELREWPADPLRRAGVSAFGVGGTNAHVVLEAQPLRERPAPLEGPQLIVLSARTPTAVQAMRTRLAAHLRATPEVPLADVAYTLQTGRRAFPFRAAFTARTTREACEKLDATEVAVRAGAPAPAIAFMFPGQGAQYAEMGRGLYNALPVFRAAVDACAAILEPLIDRDIRAVLYAADPATLSERSTLAQTAFAQPAIFTIEYALAAVWMQWGIEPSAMIGHSVGEFVAATLAGVFSLADALLLVAERGRLMQALPGGAMLAVRLPSAELLPLLTAPLAIAAVNSPVLSVASGPFDAIAALERRLTERDAIFRRLETSHAFHSAMMDDVIAPLLQCVNRIELHAPRRPYVSGLTGDWITDRQATSPEYWARHCREPVAFATGLTTLLQREPALLLEVGPGVTLATLAQQGAAKDTAWPVVTSLPTARRERSDLDVMLGAAGRLWSAGATLDWRAMAGGAAPHRTPLPTYPFERKRHWIDAPREFAPSDSALNLPLIPSPSTPETPTLQHITPPPTAAASTGRDVQAELATLLEELSGEMIGAAHYGTSFLELGFDSLFLGRFVQRLVARYAVAITFRQLLGDLPTIAALSARIGATLAAQPLDVHSVAASAPPAASASPGAPVAFPAFAATPNPATAALATTAPTVITTALAATARVSPEPAQRPIVVPVGFSTSGSARNAAGSSALEAVVRDQLAAMQQLMREQLQAVGQFAAPPAVAPSATPASEAAPAQTIAATTAAPAASMPANAPPPQTAPTPATAQASAPSNAEPSRFEVFRPGGGAAQVELTPAQRSHIAELVERTNARTPRSKELTQAHRAVLADPRVAAGFRSEWKEMVYPIACDRAKGSRLWDIDGNRYIDILNGFGQTAFGHSPPFVVEAVRAQLERGFPIGPQTSLAGQVAELFCELTDNERVTFCNTGSEAVMAALRVARTVTGRERVVVFNGAYHGQFDEVLVKGARTRQCAVPVAPGIPLESVANMVVLPYADPASLNWIREHAAELAAVVVEPVQSRHPDLQPREFLHELRTITQASGTALVFDEVVTGFRIHAAGLQHVFGIRADLATYGKVAGGGMPIGMLAGSARFMDALDGGSWQFGDDSMPEVAPTFFAGTFVRHPLTMAAVLAVLRHLQAAGPTLHEELTARTATLVSRLNADLAARGIAGHIETCGSIFYFNFSAQERLASLLYYHLRLRGVYIQEGFPCFMTTAHSAADVEAIVTAFASSFDALQAVGIFGTAPAGVGLHDIPLTEAQTEIWLAAQLSDSASCAFNESITLRLAGQLDEPALRGAWDAVVARHDALRTTFAATGESMRVSAPSVLNYTWHDVRGANADNAGSADNVEGKLAAIVAKDAAEPFDLVGGPLVRGHLVRLDDERYAFVFTAHHIVCDGWSINVVLNEFAQLYTALHLAQPVELPVSLAFSAYARRTRDPAELARVESYWLGQYAQAVAPLELPVDRPRPARKTFRGATRTLHLDATAYRVIKAAGARQGCTLFVTLLAAFDALVARLAATDDIVVGIPAAGQALLADESLVGHCVDFLPVRIRAASDTPLSTLLATVKGRVLDAYDHQEYTLGTLVRKLGLRRSTGRLPLAEIQFNLERTADDLTLPGLTLTMAPNPKACVNFDLFLNAIETDDGVRFDCDYNSDLFDGATIERWLHSYRLILDTIATDPATRLADLVLNERAAGQALSIENGPVLFAEPGATLLTYFNAHAASRPDAVAAVFESERLTYGELDRRANTLANYLRARVGVQSAVIGIALTRSLDMLVALLATLKAGYAYVPIDPTHPTARRRHVLEDAGIAALIIDAPADLAMAPAGIPLIHLAQDRNAIAAASDNAPAVQLAADDLAYAIYTSGSTGVPKGVEITHGALLNFLQSMAREPGFGAGDTLLAVTTIAFDIAALELFLPLICGGTVAIASADDARDGFRLRERLSATHATVLQATPSTWRLLLEAGSSTAGLKMLCGGEALRCDLADALLAGGGTLWNMYGPTETTVWSACAAVANDGPIVVGRPIANTQLYVLDEHDAPVGRTSIGQLHIGGAGVARGYVRRPELTAEKFVSDPFGDGRMYRTGDVARMRTDGSVEILGRTDEQVKLRGFRIELGEIETTLARHGALAATAVALREDGGGAPRLVAYYVERPSAPTAPETLRALAALHLPEYMIPAVFVRLEALPLNANGKLDRAALPVPATESENVPTLAEPQTPTEIRLAQIWAEVLERRQIGTTDDIFELGADSIQIFAIVARANRQGLRILAKELMQLRTLGRIARHIDDTGDALVSPLPLPKRPPLRARLSNGAHTS